MRKGPHLFIWMKACRCEGKDDTHSQTENGEWRSGDGLTLHYATPLAEGEERDKHKAR